MTDVGIITLRYMESGVFLLKIFSFSERPFQDNFSSCGTYQSFIGMKTINKESIKKQQIPNNQVHVLYTEELQKRKKR